MDQQEQRDRAEEIANAMPEFDPRKRQEPPPQMLSRADLESRFSYHPADTVEKIDAHTAMRQWGHEFGYFLNDACLPGRELALALTAVEEAVMWGNASIARSGPRARA